MKLKSVFALSAVAATLLGAANFVYADKTFINCTSRYPQGISPALVMDGISYNASSQQVYDRLINFKRGSTEIEPGLAESWDISTDNLTYTLHLRKGVKFHSSKNFKSTRDFNADDVIFSFMRQLDPNHPYHNVSKGTYPYFNAMKFPQLLKSVKKVDDNTVEITLTRPDATFLPTLGMDFLSIYSAEYADQMMKKGTPEKVDTDPIGTGPFIFAGAKLDQALRYKANPDYWRGKTPIDTLIFSITPDATARYAKLQKGQCDMIDFPNAADLERMKKDPKVQLVSQPGLNVAYIAFNTEKKPFDNEKVRQALNYAADKAAIIESVYQGAGIPAKSPLPPTIWSYNDSIQDYPFDLEKAKQLLAEAGFPDGFETELWVQPVVRASNPNPRRTAEILQNDWAKIGVKAKLVSYEWGDYIKRTRAGEFTAGIYGWSGDNGDPDNFLSPLLSCENANNGSNYSRWCNKEFDALLAKAIVTSDKNVRTPLYEQAQEIFHKAVPWIPVAHSVSYTPLSPRVRNYAQSPFGYNAFYGVDIVE